MELKNKLVLLRVDINAAVNKNKILDSPRFREAAKTIDKLLKQRARVVVIAHQGRKNNKDFASLKQHAKILTKYSRKKIKYVDDLLGSKADKEIINLEAGEALLLKNLRSYEWEVKPTIKNIKVFKKFIKNFDVYINEAFSASHRNHSSITLPPRLIPSNLGPSFLTEVNALDKFLHHHNLGRTTLILGGAKVEEQIRILQLLQNPRTHALIGGVLGNILLKTEGNQLGYEDLWLRKNGYNKFLKELTRLNNKFKDRIILPKDFALASDKRNEQPLSKAPYRKKIMDVGHTTIEEFKQNIRGGVILMKGPLGFSEMKKYEKGTREILEHISKLTQGKKAYTLIGGGHLTTQAYENKKMKFSHISLAGGAMLAYLMNEKIIGLEAINKSRYKTRIKL